jgi:hypothetical protein
MKSRILVCGGRDFQDYELLQKSMATARVHFAKKFCIINGFARGADMQAHTWAFFHGVPSLCVPANWNYYDKTAGHIRNQWMIDFCMPDLVIAFPGGKGTADMIRIARDANIDVWEPV